MKSMALNRIQKIVLENFPALEENKMRTVVFHSNPDNIINAKISTLGASQTKCPFA